MNRDDLNPVIKKMAEKITGNPEALFLLNIIESFIDHHEEEFRDLKEELEKFLSDDHSSF
jgi:hypothetical protein